MAVIRANAIDIHYQYLGSGEKTVVFHHGLIMDNLSSWYFTLGTRVSGFARALMYDLRGHGKTQRPESGYTLPDFVADLAALLDGLGLVDPVYLVGNSFGGILNLAFALAYPERTAGIVLIDAHIGDSGFAADMTETLSLEGDARDRAIAASFKTWLGRHSSRKRNRLADNAHGLVYGTSLVHDIRNFRPISEHSLAEIACPVLAIYGEHSDIRDKGEILKSLLPQCDFRVIKGCTHSVIWEATEELCEQVTRWLTCQ
ncbi:alpha/beta hydrolase [Desulfoluna sp.]|uniref:alpha/beta fold hydrolase n=1 Tax=Desulfoluna sp. TaxID=2045199 RepID=UPI00262FDEDD|nr:alpha/beta hydrolase [Desulfoluna sp.]